MQEEIRKSGIDVIGNIPWGTHFCQFYQTKKDLVDTLVPYFQAGLENNEYCIWVTADNLTVAEARKAMTKANKSFSAYVKKGQIEILPYTEWYLRDGSFDSERVLNGWVEKLNQALKKGFAGLRLTGNTLWLEKKDWRSFTDYEEAVNNVIGNYRMIALCTYSLDKCGAAEIVDVIRNHEFALIKQSGKWEIFESSRYKNTKEALRAARDKLAYLASFPAMNPMQVIEIDMAGKVKYCNDSTIKLFPAMMEKGIQHPYLIGLIEMARTHSLLKSGYFSRVVEVNGQFYEQLVYIVGDDKDIRIYGHDISEHKQAEDLLRETSNYLNNLLDYANAPIIVWDPHFRISRFNPAFERLTGFKSKDVLGLGLDILFPENKKVESMRQIRRTLSGERWEVVEIPILRVDGELRTVLWNSANVYDTDGKKIVATIAQGQDITERKLAEEAMKTSETKYRRLFEAAKDGILLLDADTGHIIDVNPYLVEMLGLPYREFIGKPLWELGYFRDIIASKANFLELQKSKYIRYEDLPLRTVDGREMKVEFVSNIYQVENNKIIQCNIRDITKRKLAEEEVNKLNEILKHRAAALEIANNELEAFAYSVSHDLRAPLRSMEGFSQALLEDCFDILNDECKDYLKRIQNSAELMAQLIDDMLRLSQITRVDMILNKVNLSEMAHTVAAKLKNNSPDRKITFEITAGLTAYGDGKLLSIALENLFGNALKFTGPVPEAHIEFGITENRGQKAYFVRDNGVGFDMTYANKLFKPFQRLHTIAEFPGTGIGLASVQRIIQRHGGKVWADGKVGEGAAFYFTLG
jgi:PAS domain S-box-containing protein